MQPNLNHLQTQQDNVKTSQNKMQGKKNNIPEAIKNKKTKYHRLLLSIISISVLVVQTLPTATAQEKPFYIGFKAMPGIASMSVSLIPTFGKYSNAIRLSYGAAFTFTGFWSGKGDGLQGMLSFMNKNCQR